MRRESRFFVAALALLALASGAGAQTLDEILASYLQARGGLDKLKAVQTARLTGRISFAIGMEAPFTLEKKRPNAMRAEFTLEGAKGVQAFDGRTAWTQAPGERVAERLGAEESGQVEEQADFDGPLVDWKAKGHSLELQGKERLGTREAFRLKLTTKNGNVRTIFLDAATHLEVRIQGKRNFGGEEVVIESSLGDYREVDGLKVPFRIESGPKGVPQRQRIAFDKLELGVAIDDARFRMPAAK